MSTIIGVVIVQETDSSSYAYADMQIGNDVITIAVDPITLLIDRNALRKGRENDSEDLDWGLEYCEDLDLDEIDKVLQKFKLTDQIRCIKAF
ncbi:hypothetical protein [Pseudomonas putida]|uniref:Uncharacterized protein n=1 Tax=Pseudomonas putida TaxID=303 RepID=A0A1Q9QUH8_PSEPU|nr:hypothetical protein [Pseudomonas putida]OLS58811.1 hypothetical protein PSEMO_61720 [Pseudomonas putida]